MRKRAPGRSGVGLKGERIKSNRLSWRRARVEQNPTLRTQGT